MASENDSFLADNLIKEENEEFEKIQTKIVKNFDLLIDTNIKKFQSNMK